MNHTDLPAVEIVDGPDEDDKALAARWVRRLASSPTEVAELLAMLDLEESKCST